MASAPGGAAPAAGYPGSGGAAQGFYSPNYRDGRAPASNQGGYGPASGGYASQNYGPAAATAAPAGGAEAMAIRTAEQHPLVRPERLRGSGRSALECREVIPREPPSQFVDHAPPPGMAGNGYNPAAVRGPVHCRRLGNPTRAAILPEVTIPPRAARLRPPAARPGRWRAASIARENGADDLVRSSDSIQVSSADSVRRASFGGGYGDAAAEAARPTVVLTAAMPPPLQLAAPPTAPRHLHQITAKSGAEVGRLPLPAA